jgi:hypothetical protein
MSDKKVRSADIEPGRSGDESLVINGQSGPALLILSANPFATRQVMLGENEKESPER